MIRKITGSYYKPHRVKNDFMLIILKARMKGNFSSTKMSKDPLAVYQKLAKYYANYFPLIDSISIISTRNCLK